MLADLRFFIFVALLVTWSQSSLAKAPCEELVEGPIRPTKQWTEARGHAIQSYWREQFQQRNWFFSPAKIEVFNGSTVLADGTTWETKGGPLYHPRTKTIVIDPKVFELLKDGPLGVPTDALLTLSLAHESGHHVQNLLGSLPHGLQLALEKYPDGKQASQYYFIQFELQADCLAGVFFGHLVAKGLATNAHTADAAMRMLYMGDDSITRADTPQSYVHPSGPDRQKWFLKGVNSRDMSACEPFDKPILIEH